VVEGYRLAFRDRITEHAGAHDSFPPLFPRRQSGGSRDRSLARAMLRSTNMTFEQRTKVKMAADNFHQGSIAWSALKE
jgi:hypothetical protein